MINMPELVWIDEQNNTCVSRPDVDGQGCFITAPTSLATGKVMWLSEVRGCDDAGLRASLLQTFGRKL